MSLNLVGLKSNSEIMADSLYNVQNIQLKDTTAAERAQETGAELLFGLPITGALVTAPYWGKGLAKPFSVWSEKKKTNVSYLDAWKNLTAQKEAQKQAAKYLTENQSTWSGLKNKYNYNKINTWANQMPKYDTTKPLSSLTGKELANYNKNLCYKEAQRLIEEAKAQKLTGKRLQVYVRKITEALAKGDAQVHQLKMSGALPTSTMGKASNWVKNKTGYNALKGNILKSTRGASALRMASHGVKGLGIFAIIGGLLEIPNLISAHDADKAEAQNGKSSNHLARQAVKSTVKVGANVLGYAAGAAAAGAVAGSVFPGIGNVAGAIVGFIGGCIGAAVTSFAADKVVGEHTEAELYAQQADKDKKKESNKLAQEAETNSQTRDKLLAAMYEKINNGEVTDKDVIAAFEKELKKRNAEVEKAQTQNSFGYLTQNYNSQSNTDEYSSLIQQLRGLQSPNLYYSF